MFHQYTVSYHYHFFCCLQKQKCCLVTKNQNNQIFVPQFWFLSPLSTKVRCSEALICVESKNKACATEDYRSVLRFKSIANLMRVENTIRLVTITNSIKCLTTTANVKSDAEATNLIDLLNEIRIAEKYLTIRATKLNMTSLQKNAINFNVILHDLKPGKRLKTDKQELSFGSFADEKSKETSLCPILGETHAVSYNGTCPNHLQNPSGKELKISFIGFIPYIAYNPVGGSDILVVSILAKKFGFLPKFIPARSFDTITTNATTYGMLHRVRKV